MGIPGVVYGVEVDTAFFTGNNVPAISILGANLPDGLGIPEEFLDPGTGSVTNTGMMGTAATPLQIKTMSELAAKLPFDELLPQSPLKPGYEATRLHHFSVKPSQPVTHILVNYFPDGGVSRLRVFGEVDTKGFLANPRSTLDFASAVNGGLALAWSNEHYGTPSNTLLPNRAPNMGNGWETARNPNRPSILKTGSDGKIDFSYAKDWFVMKLATRCELEEVEVDTNHFKGNFPESAIIEVCDRPDVAAKPLLEQMQLFRDSSFQAQCTWRVLLPRTKMQPHLQQYFARGDTKAPLESGGPATHARITIFPDGGISRLRMHGKVAASSKL